MAKRTENTCTKEHVCTRVCSGSGARMHMHTSSIVLAVSVIQKNVVEIDTVAWVVSDAAGLCVQLATVRPVIIVQDVQETRMDHVQHAQNGLDRLKTVSLLVEAENAHMLQVRKFSRWQLLHQVKLHPPPLTEEQKTKERAGKRGFFKSEKQAYRELRETERGKDKLSLRRATM